MENNLICLDTTVLIDYFRKTKKENSFLYKLTQQYSLFAVSIITEVEIYCGSTNEQKEFWDKLFSNFMIIPFDKKASQEAANIYKDLRKQNKLIGFQDLLIGATSKVHKLNLATLNEKHFSRINDLNLILNKE